MIKKNRRPPHNRPAPGNIPEVVQFLVVLAAAAALRFALPSHIAVEHFDEGVYASNAFFTSETGDQYPLRHLYAPPLLSWLIECLVLGEAILFQRSGVGLITPILPSLAAGCVTMVVVYVAGRIWFGHRAGLAATIPAACCDLHILLSRTALTDVLLLMWCVLAVLLFERAVHHQDRRLAVFAGLATALAWWTKYNGWLPLAITLSGTVGMLVAVPRRRERKYRLLELWCIMAIAAVIAWGPCLYELQKFGGYGPVAENHQRYWQGLAGWWPSLSRHYFNLRLFDSPLAVAGIFASAWLATGKLSAVPRVCISFAAAAAVATAGSFPVLLLMSCTGACRIVLRSLKGTEDRAAFAQWLLLAWFVGLSVMTPMYHSYPRLALTWLAAAWFMTVLGWETLADLISGRMKLPVPKAATARLTGLCIAGMLVTAWGLASRRSTFAAYDSRRGLAEISRQIIAQCKVHNQRPEIILFVNGEPALFYHLSASGECLAFPVEDFGSLANRSVYFVAGPHAWQSEAFRAGIHKHRRHVKEIGSFAYRPSTHVLLNNFDARQIISSPEMTLPVTLFQSVVSTPDAAGGQPGPAPRDAITDRLR